MTEPSVRLPKTVLPYLKTLITLSLHDLILHPMYVITSYWVNWPECSGFQLSVSDWGVGGRYYSVSKWGAGGLPAAVGKQCVS